MPELQLFEWLTLLVRWAHVITGIAWIGASFYFIWLDLSLEEPPEDQQQLGVGGQLYAIHGGGIYRASKYRTHPTPMPTTLHWFKWEAYSTWLTGSALLILVYYIQADAWMVSESSWAQTPVQAIGASLLFIFGGLAIYDALCRALPPRGDVEIGAFLALILAGSWLAFTLFAPRAAMLHFGAMLATMMAANVFLIIIPSQKAFVAAIEAGTPVPTDRAANAKRRSTHNNYLTLPVLFCMLVGHAGFVYGHPHAWLVVAACACVAAFTRFYFNEKHLGRHRPVILLLAAIAFLGILVAAALTNRNLATAVTGVSRDAVAALASKHCAGCHSHNPTQPGYPTAPGGLIFETPEDLRKHGPLVATSLASNYMPLANLNQLTDEERAELISWVR